MKFKYKPQPESYVPCGKAFEEDIYDYRVEGNGKALGKEKYNFSFFLDYEIIIINLVEYKNQSWFAVYSCLQEVGNYHEGIYLELQFPFSITSTSKNIYSKFSLTQLNLS